MSQNLGPLYQTLMEPPPPANVGSSSGGGGGLSGSGSPSGTVAAAGTTYFDKSTGNFWVNQDGTGTGWVELIGS